ncbi:MAG: hypothetical protein ACPGVO_18745, partial [Spirulinaceae cyanobacterium]
MVKGPLKLTDLILWHMGWGLQISPPGAFKLTYDVRKKVPGLFPKDHLGVPDTVQRCHWQEDWAQQLGFPGPYDYGVDTQSFEEADLSVDEMLQEVGQEMN